MNLLISFIISTVGFGYFIYGKKNFSSLFLIIGLILMIYPYFIHDSLGLIIIGIILSILPFKLQ
ncbi:MAG: hypothetical protein B6I28_01580 [Fusobacteriia bacterium 4572_132]|nr:MAG: hypothetical protein B6I28_01580 [Fusobacteriia bacterium 4572_132]